MTTDNKTLADVQPGFTTGHCQHNNRPGGCQLHNLQCGWPNCDRKAVAPSLADVQPGGRVRLGDGPTIEKQARELLAAEHRKCDRNTEADLVLAGDVTVLGQIALNAIIAALSAQPSPGGQDALAEAARRVISDVDSGDYGGTISMATYDALVSALAARQPVGKHGEGDEFLAGICVALQCVTAQDSGVLWAEIVRAVGVDDLLQYATFIEPEEWDLAGFSTYASIELGRRKPRSKASKQAKRPPAQAVDLGQEPMFYIQDTRQFVGNCPVWWAPNGGGYVTRLDEAGRYTEQEAVKKNRTRDTDIPWPCAEIDAIARPTVDFQHMRPRAERLAELALIDSQAVGNG